MHECTNCQRPFPSSYMLEIHLRKCGITETDGPVQVSEVAAAWKFEQLSVPTFDPKYLMPNDTMEEIVRWDKLRKISPQNIALIGDAGLGKTKFALQVAAMLNAPTFLGTVSNYRSSDEVFGREWLDEDGMHYLPSEFIKAVQQKGSVIILDDFNHFQNRQVQNAYNQLLDPEQRSATVDPLMRATGEALRVADEVLFIATWNEGIGYTGAIKIADNILDRFSHRVYFRAPPPEVRTAILTSKTGIDNVNAYRLISYMDSLRNLPEPVNVSMRGVLSAASKMVLGANLYDAVRFTVLGGLPIDLQEKALTALEGLYTDDEAEAIKRRKGTVEWKAWDIKDFDRS